MDTTSIDDEIRAWYAITRIVTNYCRGVDRMDRELILSCFHDDATVDYGEAICVGTPADFCEFLWPAHFALESHSHQVTNVTVNVDGDRAGSETYITVVLRAAGRDGALDITGRGRYLDRWERREGEWRISHRIYVDDVASIVPVRSNDTTGRNLGRRDRSDLAYSVLEA